MTSLFILAGLFSCHFLCDFTSLSTPEMLQAKAKGTPLWPIFVHALTHAVYMTIFLLYMAIFGFIAKENLNVIIILLFIQLVSHFIIDTWKGKMNVWFPKLSDPTNVAHWTLFGFDQLLHTLVIIFMYSLLKP